MVQRFDVEQLTLRWPELWAAVQSGSEVILTEHDIPRAKLLPIAAPVVRKPGLHLGNFQMSPNFDAELGDEFWLGQE